MAFMDDLKTDQRTQILVAGMVFFAIAFPVYFNYAASNVEEFEASGPIGNYSVEGTYSYHEIAAGSQYIDDGSTFEIIANSDAAGDEIKDKNLVGVRATLTYTDDESAGGGATCLFYETEDDQVSASLEYPEMIPTNGQVLSGESIAVEWTYSSDLVGTTVSNMSESGIRMLLDGDGWGVGEHYLDISVTVVEGSGTGTCQTSDDGEEVSWVIELISLEYEITAVE